MSGVSILGLSAMGSALARALLRDGHPEFPLFASAILAKGVQAGFGGEDLAAVIKVLRAGA